MNFMMVAGSIALAAFLLSYIRPGRFGMVTMALGVGYIFAGLWAEHLGKLQLMQLSFLPWPSVVYITLVVLPALVVLLFGRKQKSVFPRLITALFTALLAVLLLFPTFAATAESGHEVYDLLHRYREYGMTILFALGLLDMVFARSPKVPKHTKD